MTFHLSPFTFHDINGQMTADSLRLDALLVKIYPV